VAAAELCRTARFRPTKLREGYDQQQVDDLLARLTQQFSSLAGRGAGAEDGNAGETAFGASVGAPTRSSGSHPGGGSLGAAAAAAPSASGPRPGEYRVARRPAVGTVIGVVAAVAALAALVWQYVL
jgi:DivIVA domain-containing protein